MSVYFLNADGERLRQDFPDGTRFSIIEKGILEVLDKSGNLKALYAPGVWSFVK